MNVILTKAIQFTADQRRISLLPGQTVFIDIDTNVAFVDGVHFILRRYEYTTMN